MLKLTTKKNGIAEDDIAEKLLLFKISCCYLKPIDYLDMANL